MNYTLTGKSADQIIRDLEANRVQGLIGEGAYEIAAAAIQAAVARENRRRQLWLAAVSLALSVGSLAVAIIALAHA